MLRLGILDLDSSHSVEFTKRFNHVGVSRDQYVEGARVVVAVPGVSKMSPERVPGHSKALTDLGVELTGSPESLLGRVDGVLVLSVSGQSHLESARRFLEAGLPVFVDKPFACSSGDAHAMAELAEKSGSLLWSSSALRFAEEIQSVTATDSQFGRVHSAVAFEPAKRAEGNPGLLHYGIHAGEMLFALMGPEVERVSAVSHAEGDFVTAQYADGGTSAIRGSRSGSSAYGFTAFCEAGVIHEIVSTRFAYRNLCQAIVRSFETKTPAVPLDTTLKLIRFLLAANDSEQAAGEWISI